VVEVNEMTLRRSLGIGLLLAAAGALAPPAGGAERLPGRADWLEDLSLAQEEALLTRRPVLLTFTTGWCGWCRKLQAVVFRDPAFVETAQHFVPVRVDGDAARGLVGLYRVTGYPTTVLLSRSGQELGRIVGYKAAAPFVGALRSALDRREPLAAVEADAGNRPRSAEAQYALGDVLLAVGEYARAREAFRAVLALEPEGGALRDDAQLDMALTYLFNYDGPSSLPVLEEYLESYPHSERRDQGLFFHGVALLQAGAVEAGLRRLDEAMEITGLAYIKFEGSRIKEQVRGNRKQGEG
jgi:thioredoxin-like negative regulator of GroEL